MRFHPEPLPVTATLPRKNPKHNKKRKSSANKDEPIKSDVQIKDEVEN